MTVSSSSNMADIQTTTMKKAIDTQELQMTKLLDDSQKQMQQMQQIQQQNQQMAAQKTGIGSNLNILG
jgi:hypothetical protein